MKATHTYICLLMLLLSVTYQTNYGQVSEKKDTTANIQNIPTHFPLASKDFHKVSSPYGFRKHPILQKTKLHAGIDLVAPKGAAVLATASGHIEHSAYQKGYGNYITIQHLPNLKTLYAHLWLRLVQKGDQVAQGQIIGLVGDTGLATAPHLHYEVHLNNKKIDPILLWRMMLKENSKNKA